MSDPDAALVEVGRADVSSDRPARAVTAGTVTAVAAGGAAGTLARYGLGVLVPTGAPSWPVTTFVINVLGALLLGIVLEGLARSGPDAGWRKRFRLVVGTGFLGAFTTYSTLAVDVVELFGGHRPVLAVGYACASMIGGLVAAAAGIALAARLRRRKAR